jgi:uncharacterized membrane protein
MKKKIDMLIILTTSVCLIPIVLSAVLYPELPGEIPIHFNIKGQADSYLPKAVVCFVLPFIFAGVNLFIYFISQKKDIPTLPKIINMWIIPILSVVCIPVSLFIALGQNRPVHIIVPTLAGVLILLLGNYLPKNRQNKAVGIRVPWTLNDADNWNKTHRMAGFLWVISGFIIIILSFLQLITMPIIFIVIILLVAVPTVYSYYIYATGHKN